MHLPLVEHLARRFRNRGEPLDDLTQVATIGLIKSVDRFDPDRGVEFSTYAGPRRSSARSSGTSGTRAGRCVSRAGSRS
ncbi:RNA polymerase sigma factor RpoS [Streptomyces tendae]